MPHFYCALPFFLEGGGGCHLPSLFTVLAIHPPLSLPPFLTIPLSLPFLPFTPPPQYLSPFITIPTHLSLSLSTPPPPPFLFFPSSPSLPYLTLNLRTNHYTFEAHLWKTLNIQRKAARHDRSYPLYDSQGN